MAQSIQAVGEARLLGVISQNGFSVRGDGFADDRGGVFISKE